MPTLVYVVPNLSMNSAARQLSLLAPRLVKDGWNVHIATLGGGLFEKYLTGVVPVHSLKGRSWFDPRPKILLRKLLVDVQPDVVHAWAIRTARWAALTMPPGAKLVTSPIECDGLNAFDRWLLRRTATANLRPLVELPRTIDRGSVLQELRLPADAQLIVCAGSMERDRGFREAVWIFDILKYVYPNLWLLLLGDGPERDRIERFGRALGFDDFRVRLGGPRADAADLMSLATVVWILGHRGGRTVALEALAAGCAIVARHRSDLRALIGYDAAVYVREADRHEVARATRRLLDDESARQRLNGAAREQARLYDAEKVYSTWRQFYESARDSRHGLTLTHTAQLQPKPNALG